MQTRPSNDECVSAYVSRLRPLYPSRISCSYIAPSGNAVASFISSSARFFFSCRFESIADRRRSKAQTKGASAKCKGGQHYWGAELDARTWRINST